jgi:alpha-galactosidase
VGIILEEINIVLLGAGSLSFTPSLLKGLMASDMAKEKSVTTALVDINPELLEMNYAVGTKMLNLCRKKWGIKQFKIEKYTDRKEALEHSDFIISTIGVGGIEATHLDVEIPSKYGILQSVGDTVGPGGIFRALRHIPVFVEIAKDIRDVSPSAYFLNFSNPLTPLTRAVIRETQIKAFGFCTGIFGMLEFLSEYFGVGRENIRIFEGGTNHFSWILDFTVEGKRGYELLPERMKEKGVPQGYFGPLTFELYNVHGLLPVPGDRHIAEFLPHMYMNEEAARKYSFPLLLKDTIYDPILRRPIREQLEGIATDTRKVDELIDQEGLEEEGLGVVKLIEAIVLNRDYLYPGANVTNNGAVHNLPDWPVIEVPALVDAAGIHPLNVGSLPGELAGITTDRAYAFELAVDAAISRDRNLLLRSLLADGFVDSTSKAEELANDMLKHEREWLPDDWYRSS